MKELTFLLFKPRLSSQISFKALIDTAAFANLIPKQTFYEFCQNRDIRKLRQIEITTLLRGKKASSQLVSILLKYKHSSN